MNVVITGGCGFIGSALIRSLVQRTGMVINIDKLTYAASHAAISEASDHSNYVFVAADITNSEIICTVLSQYQPHAIMHLAAETHVDRSIDSPDNFIQSNIIGTYTLLKATRHYLATLPPDAASRFRFHHISTDEVFGALGPNDPPFTETTAYDPRSPYSASKAASDHLVRAWHHTYGLPTMVSNTTNNYGPWQFPDKMIPLMIINAIEGKELPIYGDGSQKRDWLFVEDHAEALLRVLERGVPGNTYAIGARQPRTNLDVVRAICRLLDEMRPDPAGPYERLIRFVTDRPGHDARYEIDPTKTEATLDWRATHDFESGLRRTVAWYLQHEDWWRGLRSRYRGERLGIGKTA